ncbi:type III secretion protein HrpB4 [Paraburkholderia sp. JPY419]|uniref:type III secretion protein HrpB4 n=1 Tax=Paraburkholderia sp. JPY419 TaxID=667660 RepID=UPI003D2135FF
MIARLDQPFIRAAAALRTYRANAGEAARWMHPSWTLFLLALDAAQLADWNRALALSSPAAVERVSLALCASAGVAAPSIETLSQPALRPRPQGASPNPSLIDVVPAVTGLQVLRMRALSFRRTEVRRLIDRRSREQLSAWAGCSVDSLCHDAHLAEAPDIARLGMRAGIMPLGDLDADALSLEGLILMQRDLEMQAPPCPLLGLALPRMLHPPAWIVGMPREIDSPGTARLFARLPELLPEWAWLFG